MHPPRALAIDGLAPEGVCIRAWKFAQLIVGKERKPATALLDLCRNRRVLQSRHTCSISMLVPASRMPVTDMCRKPSSSTHEAPAVHQ